MKTLADFKRALTIGSKWYGIHVSERHELGIREVVIVQNNCVAFSTEKGPSYLYFPKATEFAVDDDGYACIFYRASVAYARQLVLKYRKVEG